MINSAPFFWALVGAGAVGLCIFLAFYRKAEDDETTIEHEAKAKTNGVGAIFAVFAAVATLFSAFFIPNGREDAYLKANGAFTSATVLDGQSVTTKRRGNTSQSYELKLRYSVNDHLHTEEVSVGGDDWDYTGKGDRILLLYDKDHPDYCKAIISKENYNKFVPDSLFKKIDYNKLMELYRHRENLEPKVNAFSNFWTRTMVKKGMPLYENLLTKSNFLTKEGVLCYIQIDADKEFYHILESTKKALKPIYDSLETNSGVGVAFENDSLQIRFVVTSEKKQKMQEESKSEYGFIFSLSDYERHYQIYILDKNLARLVLPKSFEKEKELTREEEMREKVNEMMESRPKEAAPEPVQR